MKCKFLSGVLALGLLGCASAQSPVNGAFYNDTEYGIAATGNGPANKKGEACASSILGIVATGDASIDTAKRKGRIDNITSVDAKATSILGIYATYCTIVKGTGKTGAPATGGVTPSMP